MSRTKKDLYTALTEAGIPTANHESDLYFKFTPHSMQILDKYPLEAGNAKRFTNNIDGKIWVDVPFAYTPFWEAKQKRI